MLSWGCAASVASADFLSDAPHPHYIQMPNNKRRKIKQLRPQTLLEICILFRLGAFYEVQSNSEDLRPCQTCTVLA